MGMQIATFIFLNKIYALNCMSEGYGFDSRWHKWDFSMT